MFVKFMQMYFIKNILCKNAKYFFEIIENCPKATTYKSIGTLFFPSLIFSPQILFRSPYFCPLLTMTNFFVK